MAHANVHQLIYLSNIEPMNVHFLIEGMLQAESLVKLNGLAIRQMQILPQSSMGEILESKDWLPTTRSSDH